MPLPKDKAAPLRLVAGGAPRGPQPVSAVRRRLASISRRGSVAGRPGSTRAFTARKSDRKAVRRLQRRQRVGREIAPTVGETETFLETESASGPTRRGYQRRVAAPTR